ncbi:MAG: hypothetical protein J6L82_05770 [Alphaproteobacteria bacterium]|nr:hypothetical protein [Alphaproteobacteria bacterium]
MKKLFCLAAAVLLAGCSSIINGTSQEISFAGNVNGIKIKQNGILLCTTPCSISIDRLKNGTMITAEKKGYDSSAVMLKTKLSVFFWGNIITGGFLGSTTDAVSGGMWEYAPSQFYVDLAKAGKTNPKQREIKQFVLKNYSSLKTEAAHKKNGEYLSALSEMTQTDLAELAETVSGCMDAVSCAEKIAAEEEE